MTLSYLFEDGYLLFRHTVPHTCRLLMVWFVVVICEDMHPHELQLKVLAARDYRWYAWTYMHFQAVATPVIELGGSFVTSLLILPCMRRSAYLM